MKIYLTIINHQFPHSKLPSQSLSSLPKTKMLADADINALDSHLGTIVRENQQHHDNLQNLLSKFQELLESYNNLKSDYEEEKEGRERYKRLARGQVCGLQLVLGQQLKGNT